MDLKLRTLEREAATGDLEAKKRLNSVLSRTGHLPIPKMSMMNKRNRRRLRMHKAGKCGNKCRFCRRSWAVQHG